ncbi:di-heme oxidoredictase family protein [Haliangium sp.]|uniref:di-heme oxidoreductase family protein n=1 Tax=Haliangium sp. TaxID=2663208 RepID=UPI003D113CB2
MSSHALRALLVAALAVTASACDDSDPPPPGNMPDAGLDPAPDAAPGLSPEPGEELSGGEAGTVFDVGRDAYSHPLPGLDGDQERAFFRGKALFRDGWVAAPSSTQTRDGLGPLFNARSCVACHARDGRGRPPVDDERLLSILFRLSVPGTSAIGGPVGDPTYGGQLQPYGLSGLDGDGDVRIDYEEVAGTYGDGTAYSLRRPRYELVDLAYGPASADVLVSPRVAPAMHGLGLLEAVSEDDIVALADEDDADGDGISGRPNYVWDVESEAMTLGRFGWKANQPSLLQQSAGAFNGDIGITSRLFPTDDCTAGQTACVDAANGGDPELVDGFLDDVAFYARTLAVPGRRAWDDPEVLAGKELFSDFGCAGCHTPLLRTGPSDTAALAEQDIRPYTDMLLHDMGEELADHRPDFLADGREWRTAPLWGIGLIPVINQHQFLLHDGRARGLAEAILWHGGEAEDARERFRTASADERAQLITFLESL